MVWSGGRAEGDFHEGGRHWGWGDRGHTKAATAKSMGCGSDPLHTSAGVALHTVETGFKKVVCFWKGDDPGHSRHARTGRTH